MTELIVAVGDSLLDVREVSVMERLSMPFAIQVLFVTREASLDLETFVGGPASVLSRRGEHGWTGLVTRAEHTRVEPDGLSTYLATIEPVLSLLSHRRNRRIHPGGTSLAVVDAVLEAWGIPRRFEVGAAVPERPARVQYDETDLELTHRLLSASPATYAFRLRAHAGERPESEMVLSDSWHVADPVHDMPLRVLEAGDDTPWDGGARSLEIRRTLRAGRSAVRAVDRRQRPDVVLRAAAAHTGNAVEDSLQRHFYEPAAFDLRSEREVRPSPEEGRDHATREVGTVRSDQLLVRFETRHLDLAPGSVVTLDHPMLGLHRRLVVIARAVAEVHPEPPIAILWATDATSAPRPPPVRKVRQLGLEIALVVGPDRAEIHSDDLGRVRLRFPWDRDPVWDRAPWVPVSQLAAGPAWGGSHVPRVGHHVLVAFEAGDPERPVVVGRLFGGPVSPPASLPARAACTIWRSSAATGANELTFEDELGCEKVALVAERVFEKHVLRDETERTVGDRTQQVRRGRASVIFTTDTTLVGESFRAAVAGSGAAAPTTRIEMRKGRIEIVNAGGHIVLDGPNVDVYALGDVLLKSGRDHTIRGGPHVHLNRPVNPDFQLEGRSVDEVFRGYGVDVRSGSLSALLPAKTLFDSPYVRVATTEDTRVEVAVSRECYLEPGDGWFDRGPVSECIHVRASPGIAIQTPVKDVTVSKITYDVTHARVANVEAGGAPDWLARMAAQRAMSAVLEKSEIGRPGYSLFEDRDLVANLKALVPEGEGDTSGKGPGERPLALSDLRDPSAAVRLQLTEARTTEWVTLLPNETMDAEVALRGSVADALAGDPRLAAAKLDTRALVIRNDGTEYGRVRLITVVPSGNPDEPVKVGFQGIEPAGPLAAAYGTESLLRLGLLAVSVAARVPLTDGSLEPSVVDHVVKSQAQKIVTEALTPLLFQNRHAIPNIDLVRVFETKARP